MYCEWGIWGWEIRDVFLRYDLFCCISKTFVGGGTSGGIGGEGVCEGIDASWVTQNKIVCIWWQMFVIRRGKGCGGKLSCVRP